MLVGFMINIWRALVEVYEEFSIGSTIHGIKHTTQAKTSVERFFWVIMLILSLLAAGQLASLFYERHESASISTSIVSNQYPTWKLALPAVTLCHGNIAVTQKVLHFLTSQKRIYMPRGLTRNDFENSIRYLREAIYPKNHFPDELDKLQQILSANRLSLLELFENISPNCSDFLVMCQFEGRTVACEDLVEPVVTPYGICCSFNYEDPHDGLWRSDGGIKENNTVYFGVPFVWSILVKSLSKDRISSVMFGDGIKVMIHERYTYPSSTALEFVAASGHETIARLYGMRLVSSTEVLNLSPRVRGCALSSPTELYRADNCYLECRESSIRRFCSCTPFYSSAVKNGKEVCNLTHVSCLARLSLQTHSSVLYDFCNCPPDCEDTTYTVAITALPLTAVRHNPAAFYRKAEKYPEATAIHFAFAAQLAVLQKRELVLPKINLVSSLGGIFSLFLGCSFVSVIEVFYYFCINFYYKLRFKQNTRN